MRTLPVARHRAALSMKVATGALKGLRAVQTPIGSWRMSLTKPSRRSGESGKGQVRQCYSLVCEL